ncbi:H-NS family nucleoid-associated regulatory protein, partial [Klebsiella pneumoniae]
AHCHYHQYICICQGRTPKAIATAIEAGKTLEDFAI